MATETHTPGARSLPRLPLVLTASSAVCLAVALAVARLGGGATSAVPGIEDAGRITAWGLPVARTLTDASAVVTIGALLLVVVLLPGGKRLGPAQLRYLTWAACAAGLWMVSAVLTLVFTLSDLFARPVGEVFSPAVVADFVVTDAQGRAYALTACAAALIATFCLGIGTARWARGALLVALAGLLPPAFTGHSSAAGNHDAAVVSLALHLVGVAVWVGGLLFLLVAVARREERAADAVRRFSPLAAWALIGVAASGVVNAAVRLSPGDLVSSGYGLMVLVKALTLAALGSSVPCTAVGRCRRSARAAGGRSSGSRPGSCC
ncbi:CopD family protein [Streptomyces diastatochromogenes]|nr:CopD family protein [Streptomyces diastatochromogenes]